MTDRHHDFGTTMEGLARGLRVAEIATFDPIVVNTNDSLVEISSQYGAKGFDHLLVTYEQQIVGVLELTSNSSLDIVGEAMVPLADWMLIAASDPIHDLIPLLGRFQYQLVVDRGTISGIVTRSDLLKLPARVLAFSQVAHLEMLMSALILEAYVDDKWIHKLGSNRRNRTEAKRDDLAKKGVDPPLIECCDFCDKRDLMMKTYRMPKQFISELKEIEELRNQIAHAANYAGTNDTAVHFIKRLTLASKWINALHKELGRSSHSPS